MKKILIIEDDRVVGNAFYNHLMAEGYHVKCAEDGGYGLHLLREFRPDIILLDLILPNFSGLDVIQQVRSDGEFYRTPIIVFTNAYQSTAVQEAWKAGATKCIAKSNFVAKELVGVVRRTLEDQAHGRTLAAPSVPTAEPRDTGSTAATAPASEDTDFIFQTGLRRNFLENQPATLAELRNSLQQLTRGGRPSGRQEEIQALHRRVHALAGNAGLAGIVQVAHLASALEALLHELHEKPESLNPSTLRTVAAAVDTVGLLFAGAREPDRLELSKARILVVDDEEISRKAVIYSLEKAQLQSVSASSSEAAYKLLAENSFDLVFLDVDMPVISGLELCAKLRALPVHQKTPVVFVTALGDFEHRTSSTMAGGNDFIAKPFLFIELTVKALIHLLRAKLPAAK